MLRRQLLQSISLCALDIGALEVGAIPLLFGTSCKHKPKRRDEVLSELVFDVVRKDIALVLDASRDLESACGKFAREPRLDTLASARKALCTALLAWKRVYCFRDGPAVETQAILSASYWPTRPEALRPLLDGNTPITEQVVDELGVDAKGVYALEALLFPLNLEPQAVIAALARSARQLQLIQSLAENVKVRAQRAATALGDGEAYALRFAQAGHLSVSRLIGHLVNTVETLSNNRIELVLGLAQSNLLKPAEVQGWPSGMSQTLALVELTATSRLYGDKDNTGVGDLVRQVAPQIDAHVLKEFAAAIAAVKKIPTSLEHAVSSDRASLALASAATKTLELAIKIEVASALGVTITFQSGDGD